MSQKLKSWVLLLTVSTGAIAGTFPALAQEVYHPKALPIGEYSFYEEVLQKNVSYVRFGNEMVGALYDGRRPDLVTCFSATVHPTGVEVLWWDNLWQIDRSQYEKLNRFYPVNDFINSNSNLSQGLSNRYGVQKCAQVRHN